MSSADLLVLLPSSMLVVLMTAHSTLVRGRDDTVVLMATFWPFIWAREWTLAAPMYEVTSQVAVKGIPLLPMVGWFFTFYVALSLSERMLARYLPSRIGSIATTALLVMGVTAGVAHVVEAAGQEAGWWHVKETAFALTRHGHTRFTPAWVYTITVYLVPFLALRRAFVGRSSWLLPLRCALTLVACPLFWFATMPIYGAGPALVPLVAAVAAAIPPLARLRYLTMDEVGRAPLVLKAGLDASA